MIVPSALRDGPAYRGISPTARLLFCTLASYADDDGSNCYPRQQTLADALGVSRMTISRLRAALIRAGLIRTKRRRYGLIYEFPMMDEKISQPAENSRCNMDVTSRCNTGVTSASSYLPDHDTTEGFVDGAGMFRIAEYLPLDDRPTTPVRLANDLMNKGVTPKIAHQLSRSASPETIRHALESLGGANSPGLIVHRIRESIARQKRSNAFSASDWDVAYARG